MLGESWENWFWRKRQENFCIGKFIPAATSFFLFSTSCLLFCSLYEDDFDEDEDLAEGDIMALKGLENDDDLGTGNNNKNKPWTMVTGIDDDVDDDDDDDDFYWVNYVYKEESDK